VLNLGLNDTTVEALAKQSGDTRFAYDSYRRFITMLSDVVLGIDSPPLRGDPRRPQGSQRYMLDTDLSARRLGALGRAATKERLEEELGEPFPQDPPCAAVGAISAVFGSWMKPARHHLSPPARHSGKLGHRGSTCRRWCSGNMGETSATRGGVHPQPVDREKQLYGSS